MLVAVAARRFGIVLVNALGAEDVAPSRGRRACLQSVRCRPGRERLERPVHVGEQRIAALLRQLARQQDRAHRRFGIVAVVGVPAAADVGLLLRLLAHLGDFRIAVNGGEEPIDVDRRPAARELDMLLGRERLVAEEDDAMVWKAC